MKNYDITWDTIISMPSNTSFTGSWSGFSRSTVLASSECLSPLDSLPSKTYKWALNLKFFLCFRKINYEKRKKSWNSWQGYAKMTSPRQVVTSYQETSYTVMCGRKFWEMHHRNFRNLLGFRSYATKSRPGGKFTPLGSMRVKRLFYVSIHAIAELDYSRLVPIAELDCVDGIESCLVSARDYQTR